MSIGADRTGQGARIGAMAGLFAAALAIRALPMPTVLLRDSVQPFGGDSFYHLRRIAYSIERFPDVLGFDRYLNFPSGAIAIWTPVFDWLVALLAVVWGAAPASIEMERIAVWVPPVLGAATVVVVYRIAARHLGESIGLVAGALLCVSSAHFWYSQIGFVDHHVATALVTTILLGQAMSYLNAPSGTGRSWPLGVALGAALWVWPGTVLHVGLVELALWIAMAAGETTEPSRAARRFARVQCVALLLMLPAGLTSRWPQWSAFSPVVLCWFQFWLFGALALLGFGCSAAWRDRRWGSSARRRVVSSALLGASLLSCSLVAFGGLWVGAQDAWQWFGKAEAFQVLVSESQPLFRLDGVFSIDVAAARLSYFVFVSPIALCWAANRAWRDPGPRGAKLLLIGWTAALLIATLWQKRFFNSSSIGLAVLMAWTLVGVHRAWAARSHSRGVSVAVAAIALLLLLPSLASYRGYLSNFRGDDKIAGSHLELATNVAIATSAFIDRETPPTAGWLDSDALPEYGVMCPWPIGHIVEYVARRPTVTDGFGDDLGGENFELAARYYAAGETEALEIAERLAVRYTIAQRSDVFLGFAAGPDSMLRALFNRDGSEPAVPVAAEPNAPTPVQALSRHRLLYESAPPGDRSRERESLFKLFEIVAGAELVGRAAPGQRVRASVPLRTNRKREFVYRTSVHADDTGAFALRVPYANPAIGQRAVGVVRVGPSYTIDARTSPHSIV